MQRIGNRIAILVGIFILSVIVFFALAGEEGTVTETQEMSEAAFPVLFFTCSGEQVNETFGYTRQMDASSIRDTVTPVSSELTVSVVIDAYENEIDSAAYNVYDADGTEILEEHSAFSVTVEDGEGSADLMLYEEITDGTEVILEVILSVNDGTQLYYYTRLTMQNDIPLTLAMSFAKTFHEETLSGSDGSSLSGYLETSSGTEYTTPEHVTIESALSLVMWEGLSPVAASEISLDIVEVNESYQAFNLTYLVSVEATGATYYVEEYFRIRIVSSQAYLLDYDRTAEQIFTASDRAVSGDELQLGIRDTDVTYLSNDDGTVVSFVQAGELWEYDANKGTLTHVYGYLDTDEAGTADTDFRDLNMEHEFRILSIDDSGNLTFAVLGYVNRGTHEGASGLLLYYYDAINQTLEEMAFLESDSSYQVLKETLGTVFYVNEDGDFCLLYGDALYSMDTDSMEIQTLAAGIDADSCVSSESGQYAAFVSSGARSSAQVLYVADFETGTVSEVSGNGSYVRPIGYFGENLIYGIAAPEDVITDDAGNVTFAMNTLVILNTDLSVKKQYDEGAYYVTDTELSDGSLRLTRVAKSGSTYEEASEDTIIDYDQLESTQAAPDTGTESETGAQQVILCMSVSSDAEEIVLCIPQASVSEGEVQDTLLMAGNASLDWRTYRKQDLIYGGDSVSKAVAEADDTAGVVLSADGRLIWRRNNVGSASISNITAQTSAGSSRTAALEAMLTADGVSADDAAAALENSTDIEEAVLSVLPNALVLDLSGCTLEEVLYYVAQGRPVAAYLDGSTVLIIKYTSTTVTYFNALTGGSATYTTSQMESMFEDDGNVFYTWVY